MIGTAAGGDVEKGRMRDDVGFHIFVSVSKTAYIAKEAHVQVSSVCTYQIHQKLDALKPEGTHSYLIV